MLRPLVVTLLVCLSLASAIRAELPETLTIDLQPGVPSGTTMTLVLVPAGTFVMGNTEIGRDWAYSWCALDCEKPRRQVTIARPFYMAQTELTQRQWLALMNEWPEVAPREPLGVGPDHPAYFLSWFDCQDFIASLNRLGQGTFRLPSEAEWEYACRGSEHNPHRYAPFSFGDDPDCDLNACAGPCPLFDAYMVYDCNTRPALGAQPVASRQPNDLGLYDMHGNIKEWCRDWWHDDYTDAPSDGSAWDDAPHLGRVVRGGYWEYGATACRTAYRAWLPPDQRDYYMGMRVVRDVEP